MKDYINIILLITPFVIYRISASKSLRVFQGYDVEPEEYNYVVTLLFQTPDSKLIRRCTGSLLSAQWVLSAARCVQDRIEYVQFGNISIPPSETESKRQVVKKIAHERFFAPAALNNIGLLLIQPIIISKYGILSAVDYKTLTGLPVEFVGSGITFIKKAKLEYYERDNQKPLQKGQATVISCNSNGMPLHLICVAAMCARKQKPLLGDSGGPLVTDNRIVGIASANTREEYSFTPVSPFITWIYKVMSSKDHLKGNNKNLKAHRRIITGR